MATPQLIDFYISAEHWDVVLTEAQARQAISEENEAEVWQTIYDKIIANKTMLDKLLIDCRTGAHPQCPYYRISFPIDITEAVNKLLPQ